MRPILLALIALALARTARADPPFPPACQRPEMQVHVWLVAAPHVPGCIVHHRSWQELRRYRKTALSGSVRVRPIVSPLQAR